MGSVTNYWLLWSIYLLACSLFFVVFWRLTRFVHLLWMSYMLRAVALAIALTPWYANPEGTVMAPALMVAVLDAITIGGNAAVRAVVPLFLALILALTIATVWYLIRIKLLTKSLKKQTVIPDN